MSEDIHRDGGIVDKFIGHSVMALANAPSNHAEHVLPAGQSLLAKRGSAQNCRQAARVGTSTSGVTEGRAIAVVLPVADGMPSSLSSRNSRAGIDFSDLIMIGV